MRFLAMLLIDKETDKRTNQQRRQHNLRRSAEVMKYQADKKKFFGEYNR